MQRLLPAIALCAGLALAVSQYFIWMYAPVEQTMGLVQKIFYTHLPLAWWALLSFLAVFVCSIGFLFTKRFHWDITAAAAAELGVLMAGLALITGSLWGRAAWGVWWTWDPRLTTTLIMWFIYAGYLLLRSLDVSRERKAVIAAVLGVVAFADVPLVFFSARLWRSIHPAVLANKSGGLEPEMWTAMIVSVIAWGLAWLALLLMRREQLRQQFALQTLATQSITNDS